MTKLPYISRVDSKMEEKDSSYVVNMLFFFPNAFILFVIFIMETIFRSKKLNLKTSNPHFGYIKI